MAHQHGLAHLARRQRNRDDEMLVETIVVTAVNSRVAPSDSPKTLVPPAVRSRPSTNNDNQPDHTAAPNSAKARPSSPTADPTPVKQASTLMMATKVPTPGPASAATGLASATASIAAASTSDAAAPGMSGGAKAGLALGILVLIGALLVGILLVYRRKKKNMAAAARKENEKIDMYTAPPPPPPQVPTATTPAPASIRSERTMSAAPRLSLRPLTGFDPAFSEQQAKNGGAAGAPAMHNNDLPPQSTSAWERPGAAGAAAAPAANPFNDPDHRTAPPNVNPFGNNAAVDTHQSAIPDSPPNSSPLNATQNGHDLARSGPSADVDPVAMAGAMHSVPAPVDALPLPPSNIGGQGGVPPSPAWTEDFPASPGPAPNGPPPAVGVMAVGGPSGPPPGPNNVHRIQLDFKASMGDELNLQAGQLVRMLHEYDDGWALCTRMDRSQQGVVPRTCLSKYPVKPRTGPPRQGPPPPGMRGPPGRPPMGPGGNQPRPLSPASGRNSPHPPGLQPANGRMSPAPRSMSPGPRQMPSSHMQGAPRARSNSNAPYAGPQRSMSPGPYGGGPQMAPPPQMGRPRANSANQANQSRRGPAPGPSPMNPNNGPIPARKPVPGMAI